jgi:uncharacterized delta-60 repeat protein
VPTLRSWLPPSERRAHRALAALVAASGLAFMLHAAYAQAAPGDLDPSFSRDGKRSIGFSTDFSGGAVLDIEQLSDGRIMVVATSGTNIVIARLKENGSLDTSLSGDGTKVVDPPGVQAWAGGSIQPDGSVTVVGCFFSAESSGCVGFFPAPRDFAVARIRSDGLLDTSFSGDGVQQVGFGSAESDDRASAVVHQPDGKLVVGGFTGQDSPDQDPSDFALARLEQDGDLDPGFSGDGRAAVAFDEYSLLNDVALSESGDLVAVGGVGFGSSGQNLAVARLGPDGSSDHAFSGDGKEVLDLGLVGLGLGPSGHAVAIQGDGRIVIGGVSSYPLCPPGPCGPDSPLLVRLEQDGDVDQSFPVLTHLPVPDVVDVAVQPTGILGIGSSAQYSEFADFVLFGRQLDGAPDRSFPRPDGSVVTNFNGRTDGANVLSVQGDGKVLVAGDNARPLAGGRAVDPRVGVARYLMDRGRRDQDADGIRDNPDRCPRGYSKRRRGCPRLKDDATLSLDVSESRRFYGSLSSNYLECMDRRRVLTVKLRSGKDRVVRSTKAEYYEDSGEGGFVHHVRNLKPGRYYARAPRSVEAVGICRALRSSVVRIRG